MKPLGRAYFLTCSAAVALVAVMLAVFPSGANNVSILLRLGGVGFIAWALWRVTSVPSRAGAWVLLAAWTVLSAGYTLNLWYFTTASGGTLHDPVFANVDAGVVWQQLSAIKEGIEPPYGYWQYGYARLLSIWEYGGAADVSSVMLLSMLSALVTIVLTGASAAVAAGDRADAAKVSATAMGAVACVCYFMASGCLIIKDAFVCMVMAAAVYCMVSLRKGTLPACCAGLLLALGAGWLARPHLPVFMSVAAVCMAFATPRRYWPVLAGFVVAALALAYYGKVTGASSIILNDDDTLNFYTGAPGESRMSAYETVAPMYYNTTTWQRLVRLPFCLAVQFFTPLPWAFGRDVVFGPTQALAHVSFPWYAFGAVFLYYLAFVARRGPAKVTALAVFAVIAYVVTAYVTGGTVSRYCLPWLPAMAPAVAYVLASDQLRQKRFGRWMLLFGIAVAAGLTVIFICLNIYSPGGWTAR